MVDACTDGLGQRVEGAAREARTRVVVLLVLAVLFWLFRNTYYLTMCLFLGLGRDTDSA